MREINKHFPIEKANNIISIKKHENYIRKVEQNRISFSPLKTLMFLKKGLSSKQIAKERDIKEGTVWEHFAKLIENNQLSLWKVLPKNKISKILSQIYTPNDKLKEIKNRIKDDNRSFDEINCCLAFVKSKNKKRNICQLSAWYQKTYCLRKCYYHKKQRQECKSKLDYFVQQNPSIFLTKKEFLYFFNEYINICILPMKEKKNSLSLKHFNTKILRQFKTKASAQNTENKSKI